MLILFFFSKTRTLNRTNFRALNYAKKKNDKYTKQDSVRDLGILSILRLSQKYTMLVKNVYQIRSVRH